MMIRHWRLAAALCAALLLGGCAGVQVGQYAAAQPSLELPRYFNGTVDEVAVYPA